MEIRKIADNKTSVFIDSLYKWGSGFVSMESSNLFDEVVDTFTKRNDLEYTQRSLSGVCATVGTLNNGIYFHGMEVTFSGDYNKPELYEDFTRVLELYEIK